MRVKRVQTAITLGGSLSAEWFTDGVLAVMHNGGDVVHIDINDWERGGGPLSVTVLPDHGAVREGHMVKGYDA